ncbi:envelope stress response membrane protein PspC [Candidatus Sodalis sp. SoCistrobi]|uniref:envelope stress response membrane protein PspC n=1 Tax=Candidatus Sodalis sp. SoCistrobi TaxID=1922216 RepID=UPI00093B0722|nr:envelope stress response membrane protein PspC [Candidatus Sodalis sp. SoCistrobi]
MTIDLSKKLYRRPDEGMIRGVCAGIAHYFDVPTRLVRVIVVLSMIFGLFMLTLLAYGILAFWLEPAPPSAYEEHEGLAPGQRLDRADALLADSERQLRRVERYVTSPAFNLRNRFRQL